MFRACHLCCFENLSFCDSGDTNMSIHLASNDVQRACVRGLTLHNDDVDETVMFVLPGVVA